MSRLINSDLAVDQVEGPLQEAVDCLQQSASILTGSYSLQAYIFSF